MFHARKFFFVAISCTFPTKLNILTSLCMYKETLTYYESWFTFLLFCAMTKKTCQLLLSIREDTRAWSESKLKKNMISGWTITVCSNLNNIESARCNPATSGPRKRTDWTPLYLQQERILYCDFFFESVACLESNKIFKRHKYDLANRWF